jgi:hypothetical protein
VTKARDNARDDFSTFHLSIDREPIMKRGMAILLSVCVLATVGYFTASKWAIRHTTLTFYDPLRTDRPVDVDIAVRRDREMESNH